MRDITKTPDAPVLPSAALESPPSCGICGEPMLTPREAGAVIAEMLTEVGRNLDERAEAARALGADEITVIALHREVYELWARSTANSTLRRVASELLGAHAACMIRATSERRKGAS